MCDLDLHLSWKGLIKFQVVDMPFYRKQTYNEALCTISRLFLVAEPLFFGAGLNIPVL